MLKLRRLSLSFGLYQSTASCDGELTGASATGAGLTRRTKLEAPGAGDRDFFLRSASM